MFKPSLGRSMMFLRCRPTSWAQVLNEEFESERWGFWAKCYSRYLRFNNILVETLLPSRLIAIDPLATIHHFFTPNWHLHGRVQGKYGWQNKSKLHEKPTHPWLIYISCRWPNLDSSAFKYRFPSQGQKVALTSLPAHLPPRRPLGFGRGRILIPVFIRSSPKLAVYGVAHFLHPGSEVRDFPFIEDETRKYFS